MSLSYDSPCFVLLCLGFHLGVNQSIILLRKKKKKKQGFSIKQKSVIEGRFASFSSLIIYKFSPVESGTSESFIPNQKLAHRLPAICTLCVCQGCSKWYQS